MKVSVQDGDLEKAFRQMRRQLRKEHLMEQIRRNMEFEKPSNKRRRKHKEALRRVERDQRGLDRMPAESVPRLCESDFSAFGVW